MIQHTERDESEQEDGVRPLTNLKKMQTDQAGLKGRDDNSSNITATDRHIDNTRPTD